MKNKNVYASPNVKGIYVLQAIGFQGKSYPGDKAASSAENEEEQRKALEIAKSEAYENGRLDAERECERKIEKIKGEYASLVAGLQDAIHQLTDRREKIWQESEPEILNLVLAVSRKMVGEGISSHCKDAIEFAVKEALSHVCGKRIVAIRLSPDDAKKINLLEEMKWEDQHIKIVEDGAVAPGGCIIDTDFGSVDCQVETRWGEIAAALVGNKNESSTH